MDFLDPRKRRSHSIRLMVGYTLTAIAIGFAGWLLLNAASGFGVDTKTGQIIQNGLLFVDSRPGGAKIYLNDQLQESTTSARLVLPAGTYKLTLKKDGYRTWERSVTLDEGRVARYVYPFLFPETPSAQVLKTYDQNPPLVTQSPDRRWLVVQVPPSAANRFLFEEYDTTNPEQPAKPLTLPANVLANPAQGNHQFTEVEWSSDNKHVVLQHTYSGGNEFIIFNRDRPAESLNINRTFNATPSQVALRDKKIDQLYIFNASAGTLQIADSDSSVLRPLLEKVVAFKPNGPNLVSYITPKEASTDQVEARVWDGNRSYVFYTFTAGSTYLLDLAQFQGHWYYVAGSDADQRVNIYKDPLDGLKNPAFAKAVPMLSLNIKGATKVSFSSNTRFIAAQAGQALSVYDLELQDLYQYTISEQPAAPLQWMDGHRLLGMSGGRVFVTDYDYSNKQLLTPTTLNSGGFFSQNYQQMFTIATASNGASPTLQMVEMRAGADLPR